MNFIRTVPVVPDRGSAGGRTLLEGIVVHIPDVRADSEYTFTEAQRLGDFRAILSVPMLREGVPIGILALMRSEVRPFSNKQIELVTTFADQAAIAIENVRLFDEVQARTLELSESLEQQTATSEVLEVISSSPGELQPVFQKMLENATRICGATFGVMNMWDGENFRTVANYNVPSSFAALRKGRVSRPHPESGQAIVVRTHQAVHIEDVRKSPAYLAGAPTVVEISDVAGARSIIIVPMLKENELVGVITIYRQEVRPFTDKQIALVETFTKQAVIAIENTRLLRELRQRTDDLSEALTYQTSSANILKVIASSPTDVGPVLRAIVESACELCDAYDAAVYLKDGGDLHPSAHHGPIPLTPEKSPIDRKWTAGRAFLDHKPVHVHDILSAEGDDFPVGQARARRFGFRSVLSVPLSREGESIGTIVLRRTEVHPFSDKQIALLQTFADQAVIAIENARLFNETQEALERQTATADILKVIASSPSDVQPVFEAIATSSNRLLGGFSCTVVRFIDGMAHLKAFTPTTPEADKVLQSGFPQAVSGFAPFQNAHAREVTQVPDTEALVGRILNVSRARGFRSMLFAPLVNKGEAIGVIGVTRLQVGRFADHHVQLLKTFADQAVIAIENVRLFDEVQARTRDLSESLEHQTAISDILRVISSSPGNVQPVLATVAQHAAQICEAQIVDVLTVKDDKLHYAAEFGDFGRSLYGEAAPLNCETVMGRSVCDKQPVHVVDLQCMDHDFPLGREYALAFGHRTTLAVPLIREDRAFGTILVRRAEVRPFDDKQITLLKTFADQAAIAIENVRLFERGAGAHARAVAVRSTNCAPPRIA